MFLYIGLVGLVIGGLVGWTVRAGQSPGPVASPASQASVAIQPPAEQTSECSIVFTTEVTPPKATPSLLPAKATEIHCFYRFPSLSPEVQISIRWWHNGEKLGYLPPTESTEPEQEAEGTETEAAPEMPEVKKEADDDGERRPQIVLKPPNNAPTFPPGIYEVELYSNDCLLGRGSFVVAENAEEIMQAQPSTTGQTRIINCITTRDVNREGEPGQSQATFADQDKIYVAFTYINGLADSRLRIQWFCRDQLLEQATQQLTMKGGAGRGFAWLKAGKQPLPAGKYHLEISLPQADQPLAQRQFTIR